MRSSLNVSLFNPVSLSYQGGGERWVLEVATRLLARGHEVNVFTTGWSPSGSRGKVFFEDIVNVVETRYVRFFRGFAVPSALDLSMLISAFNDSDVVYFYVYPPNELMAWVLRHRIHRPLVGGFHTFLTPSRYLLHQVYRPIFRKALCAFRGLHVLNRSTADLMNEWGYMNTYFIPNGVDTNIFRPGDSNAQDDAFNVLYTGRLTEDKGADLLLKIIGYVNEKLKIRNIKFTICGAGPLKSLVKETAEKYDNVEYLGFVPSEIFPQIYGKADLFLIPSKSEGMPLRLLEAQSCGLPIVGSKIPGITDVIREGINGVLIDVWNTMGFAEAIKKYHWLWNFSSNDYDELKNEIRENIVENYDWNTVMNKLEHMFKMCASS